ncbi:MAG: TrkA C-terminal domain-containing protein [Acholeplasmatales bacterium]|nr:TrkA C-terminal domain-containing protein [Acholeplasmatales bacterium]
MNLEISVILILSFIMIYLILIQIFTILFRITGLTKDKAKFQAISLLTSCGFTTSESEIIANDRTRRRIAIIAMVIGSVFTVIIVSLMIFLLQHLDQAQTKSTLNVILIAAAIFIGLIIFFQLPFIKKLFENIIAKLALKAIRRKKYGNTITILDNYGKDAICEIVLNDMPDILEDKPLFETNIRNLYKLNILLVKRRNKVVEISKDTILRPRDVIVVFGLYQSIKDLFSINVDSKELIDPDIELKRNEIDVLDNYGSDAMAEIKIKTVPEILEGKPLFESGLKQNYNINVLMIKRNDRPQVVTKDTVINEYDILIVFGPYDKIKDVFMN